MGAQAGVLDLAGPEGLPRSAADPGVRAAVRGGTETAETRIDDARVVRETRARELRDQRDSAAGEGVVRAALDWKPVERGRPERWSPDVPGEAGPAAAGAEPGTGSIPAQRDPSGSGSHIDHEKLSRVIPGYVKPDDDDASEQPRLLRHPEGTEHARLRT